VEIDTSGDGQRVSANRAARREGTRRRRGRRRYFVPPPPDARPAARGMTDGFNRVPSRPVMTPVMRTKLVRASACRSDLRDHGIDLDRLGRGGAREFIRQNLDYFQAMLGYDAREREVYSLVRSAGAPDGGRRFKPARGTRPGVHRPPADRSGRQRV
jgi:hypothetical protein